MTAIVAFVLQSNFSCAIPAGAGEASCSKAAFETVVDDAAEVLRNLNAKNKPLFQEKLRQLKEKRGWTQDQFLTEAAPFVKDETIEIHDRTSSEILAQISSLGQEGTEAKNPDCTMLSELDGLMKSLVTSQTEKWTYMFAKIDAELAK
jgi:hypothetical protein